MSLLAATPELAFSWAETDDKDFIIDAPWRTVRDYVPMLFLAPEPQGFRIVDVSVYNIDRRGENRELIFRDRGVHDNARHSDERHQQYLNCRTSDSYRPVAFIDPNGYSRGDLDEEERIGDFWHYIARVPAACIGHGDARGQLGAHLVRAEFHLLRFLKVPDERGVPVTVAGRDVVSKVMRIVVSDRPLPRFSPDDRYYDAHVHSIAEQTVRGVSVLNRHEGVDRARKAFGGPLAMVVEAAYAIGMIDARLWNGNWQVFRNRIITTDHNVFLSGLPWDHPSAPGYGPTARTDGTEGEFRRYRDMFGDPAGQELTLMEFQASGYRESSFERGGHHYLFYGGPHFDGPWHGGFIRINVPNYFDAQSKVRNENTLAHVHARAGDRAFGYAAHPFSSTYNWPEPLLDRAIGWPPFNSRKGPVLLGQGRRDFIFRGFEFWNEDHVWITNRMRSGKKHDIDDMEHLDPFTGRDQQQITVHNSDRYRSLRDGLKRYQNLIRRGLDYSFKETPAEKFIRKLYVVAGSDAHGDFNYLTSGSATIESEVGDIGDGIWVDGIDDHAKVTGNAFGRLRTYTLTSEKLGQMRRAGSTGATQPGSQPLKLLLEKSAGTSTRARSSAPASRAKRSGTASAANASGTTMIGGYTSSTGTNARTATGARVEIGVGTATDAGAYVEGISSTNAPAVSFDAYRDGNTVMTNNPICKFSIDTQCRLDSAGGALGWHDASCGWENRDALIGGHGNFGGGNTGLYVQGRNASWINTIWQDTAGYFPYQPASEMRYELSQVTTAGSRMFRLLNKQKGRARSEPVPLPLGNLPFSQAFMLVGDAVGYNRHGAPFSSGLCVSNPIWLAPVEIEIQHPDECPMAPGSVTVVFKFANSMAADGGTRVFIAPLDGAGNATAPTQLTRDYRWSRYEQRLDPHELGDVRLVARKDGMLSVKNADAIPCPTEGWDATRHEPAPAKTARRTLAGYSLSYAVVATNLRDTFGNPLNDIGTTLTLKKEGIVDVASGSTTTSMGKAPTAGPKSEPDPRPEPEPNPEPKPRHYPQDHPKGPRLPPAIPPKPRPDTRGGTAAPAQ